MSDETKQDCTGFNDNYRILKETADWLSDQAEPDIDELVPKVESAIEAYQKCKDRLSKVQEMLGQCFEKSETKGEPSPTRAGASTRRSVRVKPAVDGEDSESAFGRS